MFVAKYHGRGIMDTWQHGGAGYKDPNRFNKLSFKSAWASCLDDDDLRFYREIVDITANQSSISDWVGKDLDKFDDLLELVSKRPKPPKVSKYSQREYRRDVNKLGIILTALQVKNVFPLPKEDVDYLKESVFT
jgi:hypothetical protein